MEKKLKKLFKNKISQKFVMELEDKLLDQYESRKQKPFMFWRYSFVGLTLVLLIALTVFFVNPFAPKSDIVANALVKYTAIMDEPGIFYTKHRISVTGQVGVESEYGRVYTQESWYGDNGEFFTNVVGKKKGSYLTTADNRYFSNDPLDDRETEPYFYCVVNQERKGSIIGNTGLNIRADDYTQYEVYASLFEELDDSDYEPTQESQWQNDGRMPKEMLASIKEDSDFEVEETLLDGEAVYKVTVENSFDLVPDEITEMYFAKDSLFLKRLVSYPSVDDGSEFKVTVDYLDVKNIVDLSAEFFTPEVHSDLWEVYERPYMMEEEGCKLPNGDVMSEQEEKELLLALPEAAKSEIESAKKQVIKRLESFPNWPEDL